MKIGDNVRVNNEIHNFPNYPNLNKNLNLHNWGYTILSVFKIVGMNNRLNTIIIKSLDDGSQYLINKNIVELVKGKKLDCGTVTCYFEKPIDIEKAHFNTCCQCGGIVKDSDVTCSEVKCGKCYLCGECKTKEILSHNPIDCSRCNAEKVDPEKEIVNVKIAKIDNPYDINQIKLEYKDNPEERIERILTSTPEVKKSQMIPSVLELENASVIMMGKAPEKTLVNYILTSKGIRG